MRLSDIFKNNETRVTITSPLGLAKLFIFAFIIIQNAYGQNFFEVNPNRSSSEFKAYIKSGLKIIKEKPTLIAKKTYQSIISGRVKIDLISDLTLNDFERLIQDYKLEDQSLPFTKKDYNQLAYPNSPLTKFIENDIYGYMWDDRIYVKNNATPSELASTLIHEVNHVLNKSEEVYYKSDSHAFREEYRAAIAEAIFNQEVLDHDKLSKLRNHVIETYKFHHSALEKVKYWPKGLFIPTTKNWSVLWSK